MSWMVITYEELDPNYANTSYIYRFESKSDAWKFMQSDMQKIKSKAKDSQVEFNVKQSGNAYVCVYSHNNNTRRIWEFVYENEFD